MICIFFLLSTILCSGGLGQHTDGDALRFTLLGGTHSWNEGLAICRSIGETMLHIHSTGDRDLFLKFSDKWTNDDQLGGDVWTGLYDNDVTGTDFQFVWDNCRIFIDNGTLWSTVDTTEPNAKAVHNCVRYAPHDGLKTRECSIPYAVACQHILGSCWFEVFDTKELNEPDLVGVTHSDLTLDQCQQTCLGMNTPDNLCIVFEFSSSTCKTYKGTSLYILVTPAMKTATTTLFVLTTSSSVHVKRCYEGIYVEKPPAVPGNSSDIPAAQCSNASLICTTTSPATLTTKSPILPTTNTTPSITTRTPVATTAASTLTTTASATVKTSQTTSTTATIKTSQTTAMTATSKTSQTAATTATAKTSQTTAVMATTIGPQTTSNAGTTKNSQTAQTIATTLGPTLTSTSTEMTTTTTSASNSTTTTLISSSTTTTTSEAISLSRTDNVTPAAPYESKNCRLADRECLCIEYHPGDLAALEQLISSLVLDKKLLSSYRRKKTSAPDHRVTAASIGNLGIAFLALVFTSIVLLDTGRVFRCLSSLKTFNNVNNSSSPNVEPRSSNEEGIE